IDHACNNVYLKLKNLHETRIYKIRGEANKMLTLSKAQQQKGVAAFSTGNHGVAVAYMAKQLNIQAVICISKRVPLNKVERLERMGGEVGTAGFNQDDAERCAYDRGETAGISVMPPCHARDIIARRASICFACSPQPPSI